MLGRWRGWKKPTLTADAQQFDSLSLLGNGPRLLVLRTAWPQVRDPLPLLTCVLFLLPYPGAFDGTPLLAKASRLQRNWAIITRTIMLWD